MMVCEIVKMYCFSKKSTDFRKLHRLVESVHMKLICEHERDTCNCKHLTYDTTVC